MSGNVGSVVSVQASALTNSMPQVSSVYMAAAADRGTLVYLSGWNATNSVFVATKADADVAGKPAQFVLMQDLYAAGVVQVAPLDQELTGILDTSGGAVGDAVYLSATAGLMTLTAPTGAARVQVVGFVTVVSATAGKVQLVPQVYAQNKELASIDLQGPITTSSSITSTGATSGVGYATGAGGTVTQLTDKSTGVTLNTVTGTITMSNAALNAGVAVSFTLTNSAIAATDLVIVNIKSGATVNSYITTVTAVAAGSCRIQLFNLTGGNLSEAVVLSFAVIKGVAA